MIFLQGRTPSRVVDDDVNEHTGAKRMGGAGQFAKLVNARGAFVELDECRIHCSQIQRGIRTAEAAEACISRGGRMYRQQVENAAAEFVDDVRQLSGQVAEFSRGRQGGVAEGFERFQLRLNFFVGGRCEIFGRTEQPCEGAINGVRGPGKIGWTEMPTSEPVGQCCQFFSSSRYALALKNPTSASGNSICQPSAVGCIGTSRQETPAGMGPAGVGGDDFAATGFCAAEICAKTRGPVSPPGKITGGRHGEKHFVTDKTQQAFAGGGRHFGLGWFHLKKFYQDVSRRKAQKHFTLGCFAIGLLLTWQRSC